MREKIKILIATDLLFLIFLLVSGALSGALSTIVYILAFVLPFAFAVFASKINLKSKEGIVPIKNIDIAAAEIFPTVATVLFVSTVTARILLLLFGKANEISLSDNIFLEIILHALLPAVMEEMLFRYIPLRLLSKDNAKACVLISALLFALSHHSLFSMPYAFIAGVSFMIVDIASGSVIPSIVMHFINNTLSVLLMAFSGSSAFSFGIQLSVLMLAIISLVYLFVARKSVFSRLSGVLRAGEKYTFSYELLIIIIPTVLIAVLEILL